MAEQRHQVVLAVIAQGETITDVAARFGVTRTNGGTTQESGRRSGVVATPSPQTRSTVHQRAGDGVAWRRCVHPDAPQCVMSARPARATQNQSPVLRPPVCQRIT